MFSKLLNISFVCAFIMLFPLLLFFLFLVLFLLRIPPLSISLSSPFFAHSKLKQRRLTYAAAVKIKLLLSPPMCVCAIHMCLQYICAMNVHVHACTCMYLLHAYIMLKLVQHAPVPRSPQFSPSLSLLHPQAPL